MDRGRVVGRGERKGEPIRRKREFIGALMTVARRELLIGFPCPREIGEIDDYFFARRIVERVTHGNGGDSVVGFVYASRRAAQYSGWLTSILRWNDN